MGNNETTTQQYPASDNMATKALQAHEPGMVPTIFSIIHRNRPSNDAMCMSQLFDTLASVDGNMSEAFPSIEWPADDIQQAGKQACSGSAREVNDEGSTCQPSANPDQQNVARCPTSSKRRRSYDELQNALKQRITSITTQLLPRDQILNQFTFRRRHGKRTETTKAIPSDECIHTAQSIKANNVG